MPPNPDLGSSEPHESHDNIIEESRNLRNQLKNRWTNLDQQANEIFWRQEVLMHILMKLKKKWGLCGEDEEVPEGFNCDNNLFDISKFNSTSNSKADSNANANSNATADSNCNSNDSSSKNNQEEGDKNEDIDNDEDADEDADANAASTSKSNTNPDDSSPKDNQNADAASSSPSASASNLDDTELWSLISQLIKRAINHQPGDIFGEEYIRVLMLNIAIECARLYGAPGALEGSDDSDASSDSDSDFDSDDSDSSDSDSEDEDHDNGDEDEDDDEGDDENEDEDGDEEDIEVAEEDANNHGDD